jgi:hypothetical protein
VTSETPQARIARLRSTDRPDVAFVDGHGGHTMDALWLLDVAEAALRLVDYAHRPSLGADPRWEAVHARLYSE